METQMTDQMVPSVSNQRKHDRFDYKLEINGSAKHQFFTGFTENISAGGLFVATYHTEPVGTRFRIQFSIPGLAYQFNVDCEVRWVREYNENAPVEQMPGMGVRFLGLSDEERGMLNMFISTVDTIFYEE